MDTNTKHIIAAGAGAVTAAVVLWATEFPTIATMAGNAVNNALQIARPAPATDVAPVIKDAAGEPVKVVLDPRFLPDKTKTPGEIFPVTKEEICVPGYAGKARLVPQSRKKAVYALYGVDKNSDRFEVDHLISLQLGGSNSIKNLWPQSYSMKEFNAFKKDKLENKLHDMVCSGEIPLVQAQKEIADNWIKSYCKYYNDDSYCKN